MRKFSPHLTAVIVSLLLFSLGQVAARTGSRPAAPTAISTAFTYQGRLMSGSSPATGAYPMTFRLFDAASGGAQIGVALTVPVSVTGGLFTTQLDFGAGVFAGGPRWLAITVSGSDLAPRQPLTAAPYALYAPQAGQATTAQTATLALAAQTAPWSGISGVPADLADGDQVGLTSVGWTEVLSRPAGLDDGDDNTTYTAGSGLALNGAQFRAQGSAISNTLIVAKGGGDFTSVQAALNSISDAGSTNPYLVYVATGVYTEQVTLKPYVTLEGAGEGATIIRWAGGNQDPTSGGGSATLIGANNATLRHVTLESHGAGKVHAIGLYNKNAAPHVSNVTTRAWDSTTTYGVYNYAASPMLQHLTATATSAGSTTAGIFNVVNSSPTMQTVTATGSGGGNTYGVYNLLSSPTMQTVTATATSAGSNAYAVYNENSSPTMQHVTATVPSAANTAYAVYNDSSSPTLQHVTATATTAGGDSYGVYNRFSALLIRDSFISGGTYSVFRVGIGAVNVASSQVVGPRSTGLTCFANYDATLAAITCAP